MIKINSIFKSGVNVEGYSIPVLNEREIRAAADQPVQYCPGEVCERNVKQDIQKTSAIQVLIVLVFILCIFFAIRLFNADFSKKPHDLFGTESIFQHNTREQG